ncbi:hypothetical protein [Actinoplanes sp. HUAS TT8]|uniref:hypothetical protein n=1 Tax=Actinoplanes sp. HUAS TT8 TaxID=3447453 RepID=UPI003F5266FC
MVVVLAFTLGAHPFSAAAIGSLSTSAQGLRVEVSALSNLILAPLSIKRPTSNTQDWADGSTTTTSQTTASVSANLGLLPIAGTGAIMSQAGPAASGGGRAFASVAGLGLLGANGVSADTVSTTCIINASGISGSTTVANLKVAGQPVVNPTVNLGLTVPQVASVAINKRIGHWNPNTFQYDYTVRAVDVSLLNGGLSVIANGSVVVAESTCSGKIKLGTVTVGQVQLAPGQSGTPTVTVTNTGDAAAPGTTIKIPLPGSQYVLDQPTVTGGGTCTTDASNVVCTGVTVPGGGNVKVSLPVKLKASAPSNAPDWGQAIGDIKADSIPVAEVPGETMGINNTTATVLVDAVGRKSDSGSVTVNQVTLPAGKTATAGVRITNDGPSDASARITVPIGNRPAGVSVDSADVGGNPCTVDAASIVCDPVTVPGNDNVTVNVRTSAIASTPVGTNWDVSGITAPLNGTAVTGGQGRLLTIGSPDVNLAGGLTITPATAIPGGAQATATVQVTNSGAAVAGTTTITVPAPPTGYTLGPVVTTGGGTCAPGATTITCSNVSIGAGRSITVSLPVTVGAAVTAPWTVGSGTPITATFGNSTGTTSGTLVTLTPRHTLGVTATGPADGTVSPGQSTTITATVYNQGPSDARGDTFKVIAPAGTTFGAITGTPTGQICTVAPLNPQQLNCTADVPAGGAGLALTLPLAVSLLANPNTPVTGGCVSLDNDSTCTGPDDQALPTIVLRSALSSRLTATFTPATISPGASGTGKLTLKSTQNETGVAVSIPTSQLPTGFTLGPPTVPSPGSCTTGASSIDCTGIALTANTAKDISVPVTIAGSVLPPKVWSVTGATITAGNETAAASGVLAGTGTVSYNLSATATAPAGGSVEPGDPTSMTFTVTNGGPSNAPSATFSLIAPTGVSFEAPAPGICPILTAKLMTCTTSLNGSNPGRSTGTLTVPLRIDAGADPDQPVTGGCVDVDGIPGCGAAPDYPIPAFSLRVPFASQVSVAADRADVVPGQSATATLKITATHNDLSGVTVSIPTAGLTVGQLSVSGVTSASATCTPGSGTYDCTGLSVRNGDTASILLTVAAPAAATAGHPWTPAVLVSNGTQQLTANPELARVAAAQPVLGATAALSAGQAMPGGALTLNLSITNAGPSDAVNTPITVYAPAGATFGDLSSTVCTAGIDATKATCRITLAAGAPALAVNLPLQISTNVVPGKAVVGGCVDLNSSSTCTSADASIPSITVGTPLQQRLTIATAPARIVPGQAADATITLTSKTGESNLTVSIPLDTAPGGASITSTLKPGGGSCSGTTTLTCGPFALGVNQADTITLHVVSASGGAAGTWTATGIQAAAGAETGRATANGTVAVVGPPRSTLAATATIASGGGGTLVPPGPATVNVTVTNSGPSDAAPAVFTVSAPSGTTFGTLPANCIGNSAGTVATCSYSILAAQGTGILVFPVNVPAGADPFRPVTGGCVDLDGLPGCTGTGDQPIPDITLKASFDRTVSVSSTPATIVPGRTATATLTLTAENNTALSNLTVTIPQTSPPTGLSITSVIPAVGNPCTAAGGTFTCLGVGVSATTPLTIAVNLTATALATPGATWTPADLRVEQTASDFVVVARKLATVGAADVSLGASVAPIASIEPGRTGPATVTVTNNGVSNAASVTYQIIPPAGATLSPIAGCPAIPNTNRLTCTATNLLPGGTSVVAVPVTVDAGATPNATLTGGCVDLDNDGTCRYGPDVPLGSILVAVPFSRQITVGVVPATMTTPSGTGTAQIQVALSPAPAAPLTVTVTVPVGNLPGGWTLGAATADHGGGSCTGPTAGVLTCSNITFSAAGTAIVSLPLTLGANTPSGEVWTITGIQVKNSANETVSGGGVAGVAGALPYTLTASVALPPTDSVLPGTTATTTVTVTNTGGGTATAIPVSVIAPTGTTFADTGLPGACTKQSVTSITVLSCVVTLGPAGRVDLVLPVVVPSPAPASPLTGGFVDLNGNGTRDGSEPSLGGLALRTPLAGVLNATSSPVTVAPGRSGTATVTLGATATRDHLGLAIGGAGRPAGLSITAAAVAGTPCTINGAAVTCADVAITSGGTVPVSLTVAADPFANPTDTWTPAIVVTQGASDSTTLAKPIATVGPADNGTGVTVTVTVPANGAVLPGGSNVLRVTMTNPGPSAKLNAKVAFRAPDGTTFGTLDTPASDYCVKASLTLVTCALDLGVESRQFRLPIDVPVTATPGATIDTGGCVDLGSDGLCGAGDTSLTAFTLGKPFSSQAVLTLAPATIVPGSTGTSQVRVTADRALTGLTATIPLDLPTGVTLIGAAGPQGSSCTLTGTIVCTGVSASTGTADLIGVTLKAGPGVAAGTTWTPGQPITLTNSANASSQVSGVMARVGAPSSGITFAASVPATVAPGTDAPVTVTVANPGPSDATAVVYRIKAPTGTTFGTPLTGTALNDCVTVGDDQLDCKVTLAVGAVPGQWTLPVRVPANADPDTDLTGGCVDTNHDNGCTGADTPLPAIHLTPTLTQGVTINATSVAIVPGRTGVLTVSLAATRARTGLDVTIPLAGLPTGLTITQAQVPGGHCDVLADSVTCSGVDLAANGTKAITLNAAVHGAARQNDSWSPTVTVAQGAQSTFRTVQLASVGAPNTVLSVGVEVPATGTLKPGDPGTLTATITNSGSSVARNATYTFRAPGGVTFQAPTGTLVGKCTLGAAGATMTCVTDVNGNARTQLALPIKVADNLDVHTPLTGGCVDTDSSGTCTGVDVPIDPIRLALPLAERVTVTTAPATVTPGGSGIAVVHLQALGPVSAGTVTLPLAGLPAGVAVTSIAGPGGAPCLNNGTQIVCTPANLVVGDNPLSVTLQVGGAAAAGATWTATGVTLTAGGETATGAGKLLTVGSATAQVTWDVTTPGGGTVKPGAGRTVTMTATNHGPASARNGTASLIAHPHTTIGDLTGTVARDCRVIGDTILTCGYDLEANETVTWTVPLIVDRTVTEGTVLTGGCVSADGNTSCGGGGDVRLTDWTVDQPLRDNGTIVLGGAVVAPGASGTAEVTIQTTTAFSGLTLTVPLGGLPDEIEVTTASLGDTPCTVGSSSVTCTGIALTAGTGRTLKLGVTVAASATASTVWRAAGITLADPDDAEDQITVSGQLVSTVATGSSVSVAVGAWSILEPARTQTTLLPVTLHNAGPDKADPYRFTVVLPTDTAQGRPPAGCERGATSRILTCAVTLAVGATTRLQFPAVVDAAATPGATLTGGCLHQAVSAALTCDGDTDLDVADLIVGRWEVDLDVQYRGGTVAAKPGAGPVIRLPYRNRGSQTADNVRFTIVPPAGVTVTKAEIVVDAVSNRIRTAAEQTTIATVCTAAPEVADNASICDAPDSAADSGSDLLVTLKVGGTAKNGTRAMRVTISTTDQDGYVDDNTVAVPLKITGASSGNGGNGGDGDDGNDDPSTMPVTGAQVTGMVLLSTVMIGTGAVLVVMTRNGKPLGVAGTVVRREPIRINEDFTTDRPTRRSIRRPRIRRGR